jgi:nucleoid DNA-binding protein
MADITGEDTVTKNDIVLAIADETGMRQTDVKQIVQMTLDGIIEVLADKGRLELRNFGVFEVRERKARKARNPRTGEQVMVPACKVVAFKAGKRMEDLVAEGRATAAAEETDAASERSAVPTSSASVGEERP